MSDSQRSSSCGKDWRVVAVNASTSEETLVCSAARLADSSASEWKYRVGEMCAASNPD